MVGIFLSWLVAAAALLAVAMVLGAVTQKTVLGILIDSRGRYSLTQLQLVLWSVILLSLIAGVAMGRLFGGAAGAALELDIPRQLLLVMGISLGSTATAVTIKAAKDATSGERIAASGPGDPPRLRQIFLQEEGAYADKVVDVAKYQNFWITLIVVVSYVALAISEIAKLGSAPEMRALPGFSDSVLILLGISHAGYVAGKIPNLEGKASGLTVALRAAGAVPRRQAAAASMPATTPTYEPRNPGKA